ncbi:MAG: glycerol kinase GlpK, partial [Myxococcota bacterium]
MAASLLLAIDQGTTGTTALVMDLQGTTRGRHTVEFTQHFPRPGWVEHEPEEIWASVERAIGGALEAAGVKGGDIAAIGITNQRETTVVWDRATGAPIHRAIVWQDRRTSDFCASLRAKGAEPSLREKTGLVFDPYFSGTKVRWLLDHVTGARAKAEKGELAFGTIDAYVIHRLTAGAVHATDVTNASRTQLFNIHARSWDQELLELLSVPQSILPDVVPSSGPIGVTKGLAALPDGIAITGVAGDQQAALFGQACFEKGQAKTTYGTGAFTLVNVGHKGVPSGHGLLTTIAWQVGDDVTYALEGSAFIAGAAVQWLRDGLGLIETAADIEPLADRVSDSGGVYFVPALAGLGAPYWDPEARGTITGITRGTNTSHLARATLEGIAHQIADLLEAMAEDLGAPLTSMRVDGGAAANDLLMREQARLRALRSERCAEVARSSIL